MNKPNCQNIEKESERNDLGSAFEDALFASEARYRPFFESAKMDFLFSMLSREILLM